MGGGMRELRAGAGIVTVFFSRQERRGGPRATETYPPRYNPATRPAVALSAGVSRVDTHGALLVSVTTPAQPTTARPEPAQWFADEVYPHDGQLKAYLRGQFPAERDIDDVVQESFVRLWKARATTPIHSVKAFLFRVARNVALDRRRRSQGGVEVAAFECAAHNVVDERADIAASLRAVEKERMLAEALATLPERAHEVVILCKIDGLSHAEAGERLGISKRTVDEHLRRGMKRLGHELRKRGGEGLFES